MQKTIVYVALCLLLTACATLTTTQIKSVNQFAETSKNFSAYPGKILSELCDIRRQSGVYFAAGLSDPRNIVTELDSVYSDLVGDFNATQKVDITFEIIDKYAQSLMLLSSDKHAADLAQQAKTFGTDIDSLITIYNRISGTAPLPSGIGGAVKKLVVLAGAQYIKIKQAKEIKKFVPQADALIGEMTKNLLEFLQTTKLNALIVAMETKIRADFKNYYGNASNKPFAENSFNQYLGLKKQIDEVKALRDQTIAATQQLRKAHAALLTEIQTKKTLHEMRAEVKTLVEQVKDIKQTILEIDNSKTNRS
jgi:hypothetical protein